MAYTKKTVFLIFLLTSIGGFLHFIALTWGAPFYFHPDERNILYSITQLNFSNQLNPHFFAYGTVPIYLTYFTGVLLHNFSPQVSFDLAIVALRFYSALLATLLIPSIFFITNTLFSKRVALLASTFTTFSVGLIQFAHFGTFEIWLTFLSVWFIYFVYQLFHYPKQTIKFTLFASFLFGLLIGTKISLAPLGILFFFPGIIKLVKKHEYRSFFFSSCLFLLVSGIIYFMTNPFVIFDTTDFLNSIHYESSVALGTLPVFYTGEFYKSTPLLFQFIKVYPFLVNPLVTLFYIPFFIYSFFIMIRTKNFGLLLFITSYMLLFFSQAFLFVKWTRYLVPTLPFLYGILAIALDTLYSKKDFLKRTVFTTSTFLLVGSSVVWTIVFIKTVYLSTDSRIQAAQWASKQIPTQANIVSEVYDLGIIPFNNFFPKIALLNTYDLEANPLLYMQLQHTLATSDYIIIPSQRVVETRLLNEQQFPGGNVFYQNLFEGKIGYKLIYETSCDIFCKILYMNNPIYAYEQTASVFDRPTVWIFKKI